MAKYNAFILITSCSGQYVAVVLNWLLYT